MALWSENVSVELTSPRHREGFPSGSAVKNLPAMQKTWETQVRSLGREDPLEKENGMSGASHGQRSRWAVVPGLQRVRHD